MKYQVEYQTPTGHRDIVEPTRGGVSLEEANKIASESNKQFKPLRYFVKEMA